MAQKDLTAKEWKTVDKLLMCHCSVTQAAHSIGISDDTLRRRIKEKYDCLPKEYKKLKAASGKANLKVKQYEEAMGGDRSMLIWLGKQWLDQKEKSEIKQQNTNETVNVTFNHTPKKPITTEFELFEDD